MSDDPIIERDFPVIAPGDMHAPKLRRFVIPVWDGDTKDSIVIPLVDGPAGFLLAHYLLTLHQKVERLDNNPADDWGYSYRPNVNNPGEWSRHARGIAADANATKHPNGVRNTFSVIQRGRIRMLLLRYRGCLRSGVFYTHTPDDMHTEINASLARCTNRARRLVNTKRGKRIITANPGLTL